MGFGEKNYFANLVYFEKNVTFKAKKRNNVKVKDKYIHYGDVQILLKIIQNDHHAQNLIVDNFFSVPQYPYRAFTDPIQTQIQSKYRPFTGLRNTDLSNYIFLELN